jgi:hypothetical protein
LKNNVKKIQAKLDAEQKASLTISLEREITKPKFCFKWKERSPNTKGPLFVSDKFALPKAMPGIEEPTWENKVAK